MDAQVGLLADTYEDDSVRAWWLDGPEVLPEEGTTYIAVAAGQTMITFSLPRP